VSSSGCIQDKDLHSTSGVFAAPLLLSQEAYGKTSHFVILLKEPGYEPRTKIEDGLAKFVTWFRKNI